MNGGMEKDGRRREGRRKGEWKGISCSPIEISGNMRGNCSIVDNGIGVTVWYVNCAIRL